MFLIPTTSSIEKGYEPSIEVILNNNEKSNVNKMLKKVGNAIKTQTVLFSFTFTFCFNSQMSQPFFSPHLSKLYPMISTNSNRLLQRKNENNISENNFMIFYLRNNVDAYHIGEGIKQINLINIMEESDMEQDNLQQNRIENGYSIGKNNLLNLLSQINNDNIALYDLSDLLAEQEFDKYEKLLLPIGLEDIILTRRCYERI